MAHRSLSSADILGTSTTRPKPHQIASRWEPVEFVRFEALTSNCRPTGCKALTDVEPQVRPTSSVSLGSEAVSAGSSTSPDSITDELTHCSPKNVHKALTEYQKNGWEKNGQKTPQIRIKLKENGVNGTPQTPKLPENGRVNGIKRRSSSPPPVKIGFNEIHEDELEEEATLSQLMNGLKQKEKPSNGVVPDVNMEQSGTESETSPAKSMNGVSPAKTNALSTPKNGFLSPIKLNGTAKSIIPQNLVKSAEKNGLRSNGDQNLHMETDDYGPKSPPGGSGGASGFVTAKSMAQKSGSSSPVSPKVYGPALPTKFFPNLSTPSPLKSGPTTPMKTVSAPTSPTKNSPMKTPVKKQVASTSATFIGPQLPTRDEEMQPESSNAQTNGTNVLTKKLTIKRPAEDDGPYTYDWEDTPLKMKHGPGFFNSRNDCFMNSVLQFVFHTPQLIKFLQRPGKHCHQSPCMYCGLRNVLLDILNRNIKKTYCKEIKHCVNQGFPTLRWLDSQEDAHEMLTFLFGKLEPPIESRKSLPNGKKPPTEIDKIFGGILSRKMFCSNCKNVSWSTEEFREFNLNLNQNMNILQNDPTLKVFVDAYFRAEKMKDFKCEKCKSVDTSSKSFAIQDAPKVLVIQLKRFKHTGSKIQMPISIPHELNLTNYTRQKSNLQYKLYGFINHYGATTNSGHYTATMRGYDGNWYSFDDEQVEQTRVNNAPTQFPYILFYANKANANFRIKGVNNVNGVNSPRYANGAPVHKKLPTQITHSWTPKVIT
ncbi:unnamed protein product [Bursaphelenchus xylophilus]|uniref:Ubiquitin carboxyl-terminal hydrolase 36 n=1 Tax=Bursaphelenchus xylophilus TaxID=6326 RepID=A0A1I7SA30_BURXY|nr:unnamed protein product [Bursaphelenchus xylophilus]CAG9131781.1 unnamed protein product [Bursaphelenchus xylophilus]